MIVQTIGNFNKYKTLGKNKIGKDASKPAWKKVVNSFIVQPCFYVTIPATHQIRSQI